jgi:hypothetical protein
MWLFLSVDLVKYTHHPPDLAPILVPNASISPTQPISHPPSRSYNSSLQARTEVSLRRFRRQMLTYSGLPGRCYLSKPAACPSDRAGTLHRLGQNRIEGEEMTGHQGGSCNLCDDALMQSQMRRGLPSAIISISLLFGRDNSRELTKVKVWSWILIRMATP